MNRWCDLEEESGSLEQKIGIYTLDPLSPPWYPANGGEGGFRGLIFLY